MAILRPRATIGRASNCDLVLDDPSKQISRVHALVVERDGGYLLKVVSKGNFVLVNGQKYGPESSVSIKPGDRIELGRYVVEILADGGGAEAQAEARGDASDPDLDLDAVPSYRDDPTAPAAPQPEAAQAGAKSIAEVIRTAPPASDPLGIHAARAAAQAAAAPGIDAGRSAGPPKTPRQPEKRRKKGLIETLAEEAEIREPPAAPGASSSTEHTFVESGVRPESLSQGEAGTALLRAFLEGAGLGHLKTTDYDGERFMRDCGALVRTAVEGIIGLLMARAEMRKEIRSEDRTMVSSRDNNPLRLMTDTSEALSYIFDPHAPEGAFLRPVDAVRDACSELRAHEIALMAAMRVAITGAIERFDPDKIEEGLLKSRGRIRLGRKAALWDFFVAYQARLGRDVEDDFNRVFAREFLGTYTAQVNRLRGKRRG
ncbi:MAG: type VI secretion system-associated FHA domain protein TagH [Pseudomonadota bacterium]